MKNLVIVDNSLYCYGYQIENGIPVIPFYEDQNDCELLELQEFLMRVSKVQDVRPFITNYFKYNLFELFHDNQTELIKKLLEAYSVKQHRNRLSNTSLKLASPPELAGTIAGFRKSEGAHQDSEAGNLVRLRRDDSVVRVSCLASQNDEVDDGATIGGKSQGDSSSEIDAEEY